MTATTLFCPDRDTLAKGSSANGGVAQLANVDFDAERDLDDPGPRQLRRAQGLLRPGARERHADRERRAVPATPCRMDFNEDRQLWVSAKAIVRGRPRSVVARLKLEQLRESVPQAGVVAGALDVTNNGNKLMSTARAARSSCAARR